jgi:hypothetical protein
VSDITVQIRTQRIVVNPMANTVTVVNAGPQGPPGTGGALTAEQAVDTVAAALVGGANTEITYDDPAGEITIDHNPELIDHDWKIDGWAPFTEHIVNDDASSAASQTTSVVNNRGRITNSAAAGSLRKAYMRAGTEWMDSEVQTLMYGADVFNSGGTNPATPQGGHFHRAYVDVDGYWRAIVVTNNIFATDVNVINANVWNSDPTESDVNRLDLGTNGGAKTHGAEQLQRSARIVGVNRFIFGVSINEYYVQPGNANGIQVGEMCVVDALLDSTFDIATAQAVTARNVGALQFQDLEGGAAVTHKFEGGTIIPTQEGARRWWPYWIKSRLVGSKLAVKAWRYVDPEPDWADSSAVNNYDFAGANVPSPGARYPDEPGLCGVIGAHIRNTRYFEYGRFIARKL